MLTEKELFQSGLLGFVEVVAGEVQSISPNSYKQNLVAQNIYEAVAPYAAHGTLLRGHMSYVLERRDGGIYTLRLPDVSYMASRSSFDEAQLPDAPVLAVKVAATYDTAQTLEAPIRDYLQAGTREVWLVYPESEEVYQYHAPGDASRATAADADALDVRGVFPLQVDIPVRQFFVYPWNDDEAK